MPDGAGRGAPLRFLAIDAALGALLADGGARFEARHAAALGAHADLVREVVAQTLALLAAVPRPPEWGCFLVAADLAAGGAPGSRPPGAGDVGTVVSGTRGDTVVGTCGFKAGPSAEGWVEVAYFTFPGFEGRGLATAMAGALIERVWAAAGAPMGVRGVLAYTLPERNASTSVLARHGLRCTGEVVLPEDGRVWRWERAFARPVVPGA